MMRVLCITLILACLTLWANESVSEQTNQTVGVDYIDVKDVPSKTEEILLSLQSVNDSFKEDADILEIHQTLPAYLESIDLLLADELYQYLEQIPMYKLEKMENSWSVYKRQLITYKALYNEKLDKYEALQVKLSAASTLWANTHIYADKNSAPDAIKAHISSVIIEIEKLRGISKKYFDGIITDVNNISKRLLKIEEAQKAISDARATLSSRVLYKNSPSLYAMFTLYELSPLGYISSLIETLADKLERARIYFDDHETEKISQLIATLIIISFVTYFYYLYRKRRLFVKAESFNNKAYFFIQRPLSVILILTALYAVYNYSEMPFAVKQMMLYLLFVPIIRILLTLIPQEVQKYLYIYTGMYLVHIFNDNVIGFDLDIRLMNVVLAGSMAYFSYILIRRRVLCSLLSPVMQNVTQRMLYVATLMMLVAILANFIGATVLASRLTDGVYRALHAAIIFYTLTVILGGYIIILLRRRISSRSNLMELYSQKLEKSLIFVIKLAMVIWWIKVVTRLVGIEDELIGYMNDILALRWQAAEITFSVQSIFDFVVIIVSTYFLARLIKIILDVEIFARFHFARGIPTAIATISNYIIWVVGVLVALSSLGISTQQFALIFGALGVGIGFGLRNIIANFVSGIIMVFERPVQIGDTIEVDNTLGTVQSIGMRSSAVKTFDGSEVIIPNADFIAKEVTNWTLSDERRRKTLLFKVDFDSDIEKVMAIMHEEVLKHPDVLKDPEPIATFKGFGEYYLEFKLYFWLTQNLIVAQSDIAIAIYTRLKAEGIKMPKPVQRVEKKDIT